MERKTKQRILGVIVVLGLIIILFPFFQGGKNASSDPKLVQAPPFPDQTSQVNPDTQVQASTGVDQQPDDTISVVHPSVISSRQIPVISEPTRAVAPANPPAEAKNEVANADTAISKAPLNENDSTDKTLTELAPAVKEEDAPAAQMVSAQPKQNVNPFTDDEAALINSKQFKPASKRNIASQTKSLAVMARASKREHASRVHMALASSQALNAKRVFNSKIDKDGLLALKNPAWVIQLGSFKNKTNALRLVNQLRANGYKAFIQEISTALGNNSTRVFVGPENKRTSAHALATRLESDMHLRGIIISYQPLTL